MLSERNRFLLKWSHWLLKHFLVFPKLSDFVVTAYMFCRILKKESNGGGEKLRAAECRCMYRKPHGKNLHLWVFLWG